MRDLVRSEVNEIKMENAPRTFHITTQKECAVEQISMGTEPKISAKQTLIYNPTSPNHQHWAFSSFALGALCSIRTL